MSKNFLVFDLETNGIGSFSYYLCKTEVNELKITIAANHDILRFEISVYYFLTL